MTPTKQCTVCRENKTYDHFHNSSKSKDGKGYRCKPCDKEARKCYIERNRGNFRLINRKKNIKHRYGLEWKEYLHLILKQKGQCVICKSIRNNHAYGLHCSPSFSVDHCHTTDRVRGLLCNRCNRVLGLVEENTEILNSMIDYLETH